MSTKELNLWLIILLFSLVTVILKHGFSQEGVWQFMKVSTFDGNSPTCKGVWKENLPPEAFKILLQRSTKYIHTCMLSGRSPMCQVGHFGSWVKLSGLPLINFWLNKKLVLVVQYLSFSYLHVLDEQRTPEFQQCWQIAIVQKWKF